MINLLEAVHDWIFERLDEAPRDQPAEALVHVPQNTKPPYVVVGTIDGDSIGGKGDQVEGFTVEVLSFFEGKRSPLLVIMHDNRKALDAQDEIVRGVRFTATYRNQAITTVGSDGLTYGGVQTFSINAEPA